jgi:VIT1/CCC1 family predicted Fe2+/Mn2+ transporter
MSPPMPPYIDRYICLHGIGLSKNDLFGISIACTACALFGLGAYSSKFSKYPWYRQGFFVLANGGFAAAVAYSAGAGVGALVNVGNC